MNLGFPEMLFLGLIALLVFGPRKLPEIGRTVGKALAEFKRASSEFQNQLEEEVRHLEKEAENTILPVTQPEGSVAQSASSTHVSAQEQGAPQGGVGHPASDAAAAPASGPSSPAGGNGAKSA